jgi:hypothetical protein
LFVELKGKIGVFAIGFITAKKPVNTEIEKVRRFSYMSLLFDAVIFLKQGFISRLTLKNNHEIC